MMSKFFQSSSQKVISLLLTAILLSLAAGPALANLILDETHSFEVGHNGNIAPCATYENIDILGREGGLLSLLEADGRPDPVAAIVKGEAYALRAVHNAQSGAYVVYVRIDCLGREGGLPLLQN